MFDKEKLKKAISDTIDNDPEWREAFENAPGAAPIRLAIAFYATKCLGEMSQQEKDEYREFRENLETQLDKEELDYLADVMRKRNLTAAAEHYEKLAGKAQGAGAPPGGSVPAVPTGSAAGAASPAPAAATPFQEG